jgi:hypothetical protein
MANAFKVAGVNLTFNSFRVWHPGPTPEVINV